jgi:hypothetical protein
MPNHARRRTKAWIVAFRTKKQRVTVPGAPAGDDQTLASFRNLYLNPIFLPPTSSTQFPGRVLLVLVFGSPVLPGTDG